MSSGKKTSLYQRWRQFRYGATARGPRQPAPFQWYLKNSIRTRSERLVSWLQNRQCQHYGPKAHIPELFQRRDLPFFALQTGHWRRQVPPPKSYHDLLDAAARVGALEVRLGYTFKDRSICIEALKIGGETRSIYYDGTIYDYSQNNRLALLGDRVLSLAVCEIWYQTEHSNKDYSLMSSETVSRAALAINARDLGLHKSILAPDNWTMTRNDLAETFEAILGAIYVDSHYSVRAVKTVIRKLRLDDHRFLKSREEVIDQKVYQATPIGATQHITMSKPLVEDGAIQEIKSQPQEKAPSVRDIHVGGINEDKHPPKTDLLSQPLPATNSVDTKEFSVEAQIVVLQRIIESGSKQRIDAATRALGTYNHLRSQEKQASPVAIYRDLRDAMGKAYDNKLRQVREARTVAANPRHKGKREQKGIVLLALKDRRKILADAEEELQRAADKQALEIAKAYGVAPATAVEMLHKKPETKNKVQKQEEEAQDKAEREKEAHKIAEERVCKEQEEKTRKETEEKIRKEVEEKARKKVEEKARKEAEEKADKGTKVDQGGRKADKAARKEAEAASETPRNMYAFRTALRAAGDPRKRALREEEARKIEIHEEKVLGSRVIKEDNIAKISATKSTSQKEAPPQGHARVTLATSKKQSVQDLENEISKSHMNVWASGLDEGTPKISKSRRTQAPEHKPTQTDQPAARVTNENVSDDAFFESRVDLLMQGSLKDNNHELAPNVDAKSLKIATVDTPKTLNDSAHPHKTTSSGRKHVNINKLVRTLTYLTDSLRLSTSYTKHVARNVKWRATTNVKNRTALVQITKGMTKNTLLIEACTRETEQITSGIKKRSGQMLAAIEFSVTAREVAGRSFRRWRKQIYNEDGQLLIDPLLPGSGKDAHLEKFEEERSTVINNPAAIGQEDPNIAQPDTDRQDSPAGVENSKIQQMTPATEQQAREEEHTRAALTSTLEKQQVNEGRGSLFSQIVESETTHSTIETSEDMQREERDAQEQADASESSSLPVPSTQEGNSISKDKTVDLTSFPTPPASDPQPENIAPTGVVPQVTQFMEMKHEQSHEAKA
jgi:dsRNA-specific ribonuclease